MNRATIETTIGVVRGPAYRAVLDAAQDAILDALCPVVVVRSE